MSMNAKNFVTDFGAQLTTAFDGTPQNEPDCVSAWNTAIAYCAANKENLYIPDGTYSFHSKPDLVNNRIDIFGAGLFRTSLYMRYNQPTGAAGFIEAGPYAVGFQLRDTAIIAGPGNVGATGFRAYANSVSAPSSLRARS